jgi:hypothetical protein
MQGRVHKIFFIYYITNINKIYDLVVLHLPKKRKIMEKVEEYQFKLVEGQYTTVEAQKNSIRAYETVRLTPSARVFQYMKPICSRKHTILNQNRVVTNAAVPPLNATTPNPLLQKNKPSRPSATKQ